MKLKDLLEVVDDNVPVLHFKSYYIENLRHKKEYFEKEILSISVYDDDEGAIYVKFKEEVE